MFGMLVDAGGPRFEGPAPPLGVGGAVFIVVGNGPGTGGLGPGGTIADPGGPGCPGALAEFRGDAFSPLPSTDPSFPGGPAEFFTIFMPVDGGGGIGPFFCG